MKEIILKKIECENFRGLKLFDSNIGEHLTVIAGDNATGKSSIFAAFTWALFGKDELDRKDFEIKPCIDGKSVRADVSVTLHIIVDGRSHLLKRVFREKWVRHKNEVEDTFEGNETICYWDEAPVSVTEYKRRVSEIVDESLFKMLTNPYYFPTMKWQDQRAALFSIVPTINDDELAQRDDEFKALLDELNGESLADFKAKINRALKTLRKDSSEIQPRIDEQRRSMPEVTKTREEIETHIEELKKSIDSIDAQLKSQSDAALAHSNTISEKRRELNNAVAHADELVNAARNAERERVAKANADYDQLKRDIEARSRQLQGDLNYLESYQKQTERYIAERERIAAQKNWLRDEYLKVDSSEYTTSDICPMCGQQLPESMRNGNRENFNRNKQSQLEDITKRGLALKEQLAERDAEIEKRNAEQLNLAAKYDALQTEVEDMTSRLSKMSVETEQHVDESSVAGYAEAMQIALSIKEEIAALEASDGRDTDTENRLSEERTKLRDEFNEAQRELGLLAQRESAEKRIDELEKQGRELAQQIADLEKKVFIATKFEQAKVADLEEQVNSKFHSVKWRLFDYTLDGNVVETCVPIVGDALYPVANSAAKINAGLDIIHTLSERFGVRCPIFIDNAESITSIESYDLQLITLYVEKGAKLEVREIK